MSPKLDKRPTYLAITVVAGCVVAASLLVGALFAAGVLRLPEPPISVPNITGLDVPTARSRLAQVGLLLERGDTRFSASVPAGGVVEQRPGAGTLVQPGAVIVVAVSAGSESFPMPDITGLPVTAALETLKSKGLSSRVERVESRLASGTVVSTLPAPGADVSTADVVTVRVSAGAKTGALLLPFKLTGVRVVLDPEPTDLSPDSPDEVSRRLRSLLEASGAQVVVTRSVVDTNPPPAQRQLKAMDSSATVVLSIYAAPSGSAGVNLATPPSDGRTAPYYLRSVELQKKTQEAFREGGMAAALAEPSMDQVISGVASPGIRVHLGSYADKKDARDFGDPSWADIVARALYRGIGQTFAPRAQTAPGQSVPASGGTSATVGTTATP